MELEKMLRKIKFTRRVRLIVENSERCVSFYPLLACLFLFSTEDRRSQRRLCIS